MILPDSPQFHTALALISWLNQAGHQAFFVGGCVRDWLLGRPVGDYDLCTSALPQEMTGIFAHTVDTGSRFGTITVKYGDYTYEVTTFRGEGTYGDCRHPDEVSFGVSLEEDLARRDFTINALAYHPDTGVIDLFSGQTHLEEGLLVAVGVAEIRFQEDALRILRGLRFAATLGFVIEDDTAYAMLSHWQGLLHLAQERITQEIEKLVMGEYLERLLFYTMIFEEGIFMGLPCLVEAEESWQMERKLEAISKAPPVKSLRLALFLSLFAPESDLLRLSKKDKVQVDFLLQQPCLIWLSPEEWVKFICKEGRDRARLLLSYQIFHYPYHRMQLEALSDHLENLPCTNLQELDLSGFDLIAAGVTPGETVGKLLHIALELVVSGVVANENKALLDVILGDSPHKSEN